MAGLHHVTRGGEPLTIALSPTVTLTKVSVGPMDNNAYVLEGGGGLVLVDAADDAATLLAVLGDRDLDAVVTTHRHADHWQALADVARTGARLVAGTPDAGAIPDDAGVTRPDGVWDGDTVALGSEHLDVVGLVGHTPGSVLLAYRGGDGPTHLFTGDSLFPGGPGRTRSPEDFTSLMDDLEAKVFAVFDDDTVVHPGHGDGTTLGAERPHLQEWRERGW
ncbi:Glyoxylase, beta-lactamase superfamily II [Microlunatus sagamiharensis]|uniref:Glyoxylase, beta-lactamase superfamily II n=1 Tax=Microlunatus sagamiharensis TaxID=546874 RepID=A0A1H2MN18_9ACTN|nr:MBL fold metallo-hydrolase [Microlunatus sagamiharensis]SDU94492.1 Glyoxylase, beta-lactamase superfamily II [Microlunatus sagamiharensis]